jgi:pimeloyl-ACP methyl ester carboxylesterase
VAWLPYSYAGVFDDPGAVASYFGDTTGQALATSVAQLEAVVRLALRFTPPDVRIIVIGHSLGGAIGSLWGADHPTATIVTLDSPVNGIWVTDAPQLTTKETLTRYCDRSVGGLLQSNQRPGCQVLAEMPALYSAVADDLRDARTRLRLGGANTINFANPADVVVPAWYALNPASGRRYLEPADRCLPQPHGAGVDALLLLEDFETHHACILDAAAAAVGAIVAGRTPAGGDPPASSIRLLVDVGDGAATGDAITVRHGDVVVATGRAAGGGAAVPIDVPWTDLIVEAAQNGTRQQIGVLSVQPGAEVTVSFP